MSTRGDDDDDQDRDYSPSPPPAAGRDRSRSRDGPRGGERRGRGRSYSPSPPPRGRPYRSRSRSPPPHTERDHRRRYRDRSGSPPPRGGGGGRYRDYDDDRHRGPPQPSHRDQYPPYPPRGGPPPPWRGGGYHDNYPPPDYYDRGYRGGRDGPPPFRGEGHSGPPPNFDRFGDRPGPSPGRRDGRRRDEGPPGVSLLIRNISPDIVSQDLQQAFGRIGELRDVYIPRDFHSQQPKGFAFIEYANAEMAAEARDEMNHFVIKGREIEVVFAQERRKTPNEMRGRVVNQQNHRVEDVRKERSSSFERHKQLQQNSTGKDKSSINAEDTEAPVKDD